MKKIFLVIMMLFLVGCEKQSLDLNKINNIVKADIKDSMKLSNSEIEGIYNIDTSVFKNATIYVDKNSESSNVYAIFEAKSDYDSALLEAEYFMEQYKKAWDNDVLKEESNKIKNGKSLEYEDYIIYVVSDNANEALDKIKECTK